MHLKISQSSPFSSTLRHLFRSGLQHCTFLRHSFLHFVRGKEGGGGLFIEMTLRGNTGQACAACKYQRRKCTPECPLAPYFPADQPKMFRNVHRLFGVSKIQKLLEDIPQSQHNEAMSSIIYQAEIRDRFPVFGCVEVIQLLRAQIRQCEEELYTVHGMLAMYRHQHDQQHQQLQLGMAPSSANNDAALLYLQNPPAVPQHYSPDNVIPDSQNYSDSSSNSPNNSSYLGAKETLVNSLWIQHLCGNDSNNSDNDNTMPIQSHLVISHSQVQQEAFQDYDEMHPYFDAVDDRQSYIDSHEACDSRY